MKTLIFSLVLMLFSVVIHAQDTDSNSQIIELDEAKLRYYPGLLNNENSFSVTVLENYTGEFEKNPIAFMKNNIDMKAFISQLQDRDYHSYLLRIRSTKGELQAEFDKVGNLLNTSQRFENIFLPKEIRHQLYREHKGWRMVKNVHIAKSWKDIVNKDFYRITMKNGNETKTLKIDAPKNISTTVVSQ